MQHIEFIEKAIDRSCYFENRRLQPLLLLLTVYSWILLGNQNKTNSEVFDICYDQIGAYKIQYIILFVYSILGIPFFVYYIFLFFNAGNRNIGNEAEVDKLIKHEIKKREKSMEVAKLQLEARNRRLQEVREEMRRVLQPNAEKVMPNQMCKSG